MKLNENIKPVLESFGIIYEEAIPYLLSLYFGFNPDYIPDYLKQKVNISKIVEMEDDVLKWNIPLFEGAIVDQKWEWVATEYVALFAAIGKGTHKREALTRMKRLFSANPDIRKDEVIGATEMYLYNTESKYARLPHYFIEKGTGGDKTQDILEWIEKYRLVESDKTEDRDMTRRLL